MHKLIVTLVLVLASPACIGESPQPAASADAGAPEAEAPAPVVDAGSPDAKAPVGGACKSSPDCASSCCALKFSRFQCVSERSGCICVTDADCDPNGCAVGVPSTCGQIGQIRTCGCG